MKKYHSFLGEVSLTGITFIYYVLVKTLNGDTYLVEPCHLTDIQVVSPTVREIGQRAPVSSKMLDCPKAV